MKMINKMLMTIGLLAISSMGFASSVSVLASTSAGSAGTVILDSTGPATIFTGVGSTGSIYYDLITTFDTNTFTVATSTKSTETPPDQPITVSLFRDVAGAGAGIFDATDIMITSALANITSFLSTSELYFLEFVTTPNSGISANISAVPVPAAGILFASALFGAGFMGRRKKKVTKSNMIGAFARTV